MMNSEYSESELLLKLVEEKISHGFCLLEQLEDIQELNGVSKLKKKIQQEVNFLKRLQTSKKVKKEQLSCSNLTHLSAMVSVAKRPGVVAVCKIFHTNDGNKLNVDIINDQGRKWMKVIARNPKSLSALSSGDSSYGARSILDQAVDYLEGAKFNQCMYQTPIIVFEFINGIEESLAKKLKSLGIEVNGQVITNSLGNHSESESDEEINDEYTKSNLSKSANMEVDPNINTLNLDVTTMMVYVSNMTNGHCNYVFKQNVLTQQSRWESERPVKPVLDSLFQGKALVCCQTAWDEFQEIVDTLGGINEINRAKELKSRLKIFPDDYGGLDDERRANLKVRGHIRMRSKIVFNFGHRIRALTISANVGFLRAAQQQGISYTAFIHESRALTEGKEPTATLIAP